MKHTCVESCLAIVQTDMTNDMATTGTELVYDWRPVLRLRAPPSNSMFVSPSTCPDARRAVRMRARARS
jgi:hypothetical protein